MDIDEKDIVENTGYMNETTYLMDIVEKVKNCDTWDDIVKHFSPFMDAVAGRIKKRDESMIKDFYIMKLLSSTKIHEEYPKLEQVFKDSYSANRAAHDDVMADILKLHHNKDKLDAVLEAQTQLLDREKKEIREEWKKQDDPETKLDNAVKNKNREEWKKQHGIEIKDENLVVEDSKMEEYLKAKCDELVNFRAKMIEIWDRQLKMRQFVGLFFHTQHLIDGHWIFQRASKTVHSQYAKQIKDMWPIASSEDLIVPSLEDDIFGIRRWLDERRLNWGRNN